MGHVSTCNKLGEQKLAARQWAALHQTSVDILTLSKPGSVQICQQVGWHEHLSLATVCVLKLRC